MLHREVSLDVLRGIASLLVCANHLRAVSVESYHGLSNSSLIQNFFFLMTSLGHQSVIVFFVLSGYFVGGSLLARGATFSWRDYAVARLTRLWIVLVPALFLVLAVDLILWQVAPGVFTGAFATIWNMGPQVGGGDYTLSMGVFIGNLFFLQEIFIPVFGSNHPMWSLAYEFWYYVLFPLLLISLGDTLGAHRIYIRVGMLLLAVLIFLFLPDAARVGFLCWLGGVAVYAFKRVRQPVQLPVWLGVLIFAFGVGLSRWLVKDAYSPLLVDFAMGGATVLFLFAIANRAKPLTLWSPLSRGTYYLSEMSYSLYLIHFPIVLLIGATVFGSNRLMPNQYGLTVYLCWLSFLLVIAWGFWYIFERHTPYIRRVVQQLLGYSQ